jgi:hypothetical protein
MDDVGEAEGVYSYSRARGSRADNILLVVDCSIIG